MTPYQVELGRHALGLPNKRKTSYRNHFCAGLAHSDYSYWAEMVRNGYAKKHSATEITGGDDLFVLTKAGALLCLSGDEKLDVEDFGGSEVENGAV